MTYEGFVDRILAGHGIAVGKHQLTRITYEDSFEERHCNVTKESWRQAQRLAMSCPKPLFMRIEVVDTREED